MSFRLGVDTGGTFTDLVLEDDAGNLRLFKSPTTPADIVQGVLDVLEVAARCMNMSRFGLLQRSSRLIHGTTAATNALVTGRQARTAFVTTRGHPDVLVLREGGRIGLPMFDYSIEYPSPFIPRSLTFELSERIAQDGAVLEELQEQALDRLVEQLRAARPDAVAVCLLWSIANPVHEVRVGDRLRAALPGVFVNLSHQVNPTIREYRRASATAIDAALKPIMWSYLARLENELRGAGFGGQLYVVTSQGAMKDAREVAERPIHLVKSGPALAPVAGRYFAALDCARDTAIITDTGGTTYDVALVRHGQIPQTRETWIGRPYIGHMTGFPSVDIRSVGAGGGSIASVDAGGLLHVGPASAGADPGPACYGRGGDQATVTDAALLLGYLEPGHFLGGQLQLDRTRAVEVVRRDVAVPLGIEVDQAALAILQLLTETMAGAIEDITVNQGIDPRSALLIGGGGAAGFNAVAVARRLGCPSVLFPGVGAALSASGGIICPISDTFTEFYHTSSRSFAHPRVASIERALRARCAAYSRAAGAPGGRVECHVEARYLGQIWEIKVPVEAGEVDSPEGLERLVERFHNRHQDLFAISDRRSEIEFVSWQASISIEDRDRPLGRIVHATPGGSPCLHRRITLATGSVRVPVLAMNALRADQTHNGPAIIETDLTTIVVDGDATFRPTASGGVEVFIGTPPEP